MIVSTKVMRRVVLLFIIPLFLSSEMIEEGHTINFQKVSILEFVKFVSRIAQVNFVFDENDLDFEVSFVSGKAATPENVLSVMTQILEKNGIRVEHEDGYYLIEKMTQDQIEELRNQHSLKKSTKLAALTQAPKPTEAKFEVYKLQYNQGDELLGAIKQVAGDMKRGGGHEALLASIASLQYLRSNNSFLYSGSGSAELTSLIKTLDIPQKQVFIEVLVIETSVRDSLEFGLEWAAKGRVQNRLNFGVGNFGTKQTKGNFASNFKELTPFNQQNVPLGKGFDLGVIGDLILHKGKTFLTLGSLVSALEKDGQTNIILNQKIITQDNKESTIFVGENIPFTGSVVETVGASQQTTSNIEYRDVGVNLKITPLLGDGDVITLDIKEDISEARNQDDSPLNQVNGILTTKTNMLTRAHVPDDHFLVLSGMSRNKVTKRKSGVPCLGGLPLIGALFSKTTTENEKRNVIIFVKPQIVNSTQTYDAISSAEAKQNQEFERVYREHTENQN